MTCQRPLPRSDLGMPSQCAPCLKSAPRHAGIYAATLYNETSRKLVLNFKHGRRIALAKLMARLMHARIAFIDMNLLLIPVPLHRWRLWKRGYNQAGLLAQELGKRAGMQVLADGLQRHRATPSLGGLGRKARERSLAGAIRLNPATRSMVAGKDVLLVDDVVTSGATSDQCTKVLLKAGACSVRIACFARVLNEIEEKAGVSLESETPEAFTTPGAT